jgi:hypothetical protein
MNEDTAAAARAMSDAVNRGARPGELAEELARDHRTLVQLKADVFIRFFRLLADDYERGFYDARNEAACQRAKVIVEALDAAGYDYDGMPFI